MITVEDYLMGRDKEFPLDMLQARNMANLLSRVNFLLATLKIETTVSSGYRPSALNKKIGGAKMSTHTVCAGIDLHDSFGKIGTLLTIRKDLLEKCGLYLENPSYTKKEVNGLMVSWIHLDIKKRNNIIFNP